MVSRISHGDGCGASDISSKIQKEVSCKWKLELCSLETPKLRCSLVHDLLKYCTEYFINKVFEVGIMGSIIHDF